MLKFWPDFCCSSASWRFFAVFTGVYRTSHEIFLASHVLL
ncbi:hypothetical protein DLM_2561 [Aquitalea magnusonii]|uniref:Uncharacterized protein n=1 Tax=Aquitalea magnusonii TaxID=332411 RepID=A0A3G9GL60_9NEIS|nr:hypothetical protein DLM_2561 [Aquitalea magnusonii]